MTETLFLSSKSAVTPSRACMLHTTVLTLIMCCIDVKQIMFDTVYPCTLRLHRVMNVLFVFVELKQLEVQPVPENLTVLDLSWYEDTLLSYLQCGRVDYVLVLSLMLTAFMFFFFFFKGTS